MIEIDHIDHIVLTVASIDRTCAFYEKVLGMKAEIFAGGRTALHFGGQKINLHQAGQEYEPRAKHPTPGSMDLCFIAKTRLDEVIAALGALCIPIEVGPVDKTGAMGPLRSVYIRDPDANLIEISNFLEP